MIIIQYYRLNLKYLKKFRFPKKEKGVLLTSSGWRSPKRPEGGGKRGREARMPERLARAWYVWKFDRLTEWPVGWLWVWLTGLLIGWLIESLKFPSVPNSPSLLKSSNHQLWSSALVGFSASHIWSSSCRKKKREVSQSLKRKSKLFSLFYVFSPREAKGLTKSNKNKRFYLKNV